MCASAPALAQPRPPPPRHLLEAPILTIRPHGTLAAFNGEGVKLVVGWRPVNDAARYRVTITNATNNASDLETVEPRIEKQGLPPGRYHVTVTAIDRSGSEGAISEALPINVIEIHAVPPGADGAMPPTRNAYAVGTRFSAPGMHCETGNAPIDDLLVGPENELRVTKPGLVTLRCAGIPGYLEKQIVIAPIRMLVQTPVLRGATTTIHVTIGTVARVGTRLDVTATGDISIGPTTRTEFGLDIPVTATEHAKRAALAIRGGDFELGQIPLTIAEPSMTMPPRGK